MRYLIVANWKCNPTTLREAKRLFNSVIMGSKNVRNAEVVICPPFVYLSSFKFQASGFKLGAQDCFWKEKGAFTGEVSAKMLKDFGVKYIILGHSERRKYFYETDEIVNKKLKAALEVGLKPILCVSSKKRGEAARKEMEIQMKKDLDGIRRSEIKDVVVTYEPIWAISTTKNSVVATPENTKEGEIFIRESLSKLFSKSIARKTRIIYGGSVDNTNIEGFIKKAKMDGVLIGAASLRPADFIAAVKKVDFLAKKR